MQVNDHSGLRALAADGSALDKRQLAVDTARKFEQIFVQQMVQALRNSVASGESDGLFGKGPGSGTYEDWFDLHLGRHLTENGGVGLARMMLHDWERHGWVEPDNQGGKSDVDA